MEQWIPLIKLAGICLAAGLAWYLYIKYKRDANIKMSGNTQKNGGS